MNKVLKALLILITAMTLFATWYVNRYSMTRADSMDYPVKGTPKYSVLIATQGSNYKNKLVKKLIDELRINDRAIKVIDVNDLKTLTSDHDAYIIIHTWEIGKAPEAVSLFVNNYRSSKNIYTISTSGSGDEIMDDIDGISSASNITDI